MPIFSALAELAPGFLICPSETNQADFVKAAADFPEIAVRINMPVSALLESDWKKTALIADSAMALARSLPKGSVGTGIVPFDVSPDLILRLRDHIQKKTENHAHTVSVKCEGIFHGSPPVSSIHSLKQ